MTNSFRIICGLAVVVLAGCSGKNNEARQSVKPPLAVESAVARMSAVAESIEVTGTLEPKYAVDVKTQIPGLIRNVYVNEWVPVRKGQILARIDVSESEAMVTRAEAERAVAKANLSQADVTRIRAEREMARILKLKESGLATGQAVDDARTEHDAAQAKIAAARAQHGVAEESLRQSRAHLAKGVVIAPMDGVIALKAVNVGDLASDAAVGKPIFRIVDNRLLNVTVTVSSTDSSRIKVGQQMKFSVDSLPGKTFSGTVKYINPELSSSDRSLKVIAEVRNQPELLKGGLFAKGEIITGSRSEVLMVPRSTLAAWDINNHTANLFLITGDKAMIRPVKTGQVHGDQVEIVSGLATGEQYVVRGAFNLKGGDTVVVSGGKKP